MMLEPTIEELILSGVVEVSSVDPDSGEFLYSFTNKLHEVMPDFFNRKLDFVKQEVDFFLETGFLEVNDPRAKNPIIFLTDKAFDEEEVSTLSKNKQKSLKEIKRLFEER
jgi:F0F1-type ATP synthase epsilon subunit